MMETYLYKASQPHGPERPFAFPFFSETRSQRFIHINSCCGMTSNDLIWYHASADMLSNEIIQFNASAGMTSNETIRHSANAGIAPKRSLPYMSYSNSRSIQFNQIKS